MAIRGKWIFTAAADVDPDTEAPFIHKVMK